MSVHTGRNAADEEARAEVDVLQSRLEKTAQLNKQIQASLTKLELSGKRVQEVSKPLWGETAKLQLMAKNVDSVLEALEQLRQPVDSKNDEDQIIRAGPDKVGLSNYLASVKRLAASVNSMQASNLRANQQTITEFSRMLNVGNSQLETYFTKTLQTSTPPKVEPLHFITKEMPFPKLGAETYAPLGLINSHLVNRVRQMNPNNPHAKDTPLGRAYIDIRSAYMTASLVNLSMASSNTAKKTRPDAIYLPGTNAIGSYAKALEGMCLAEYENITNIFARDEWGIIFQAVCQSPLSEFARTIRELNNHIKTYLTTDCYLAFEITGIISELSQHLENVTNDLKASLTSAVLPIRETAKAAPGELLEDMKRRIAGITTLPPDGAAIPLVSEVMVRLKTMLDFLLPVSGIMIALGDGGWRAPRGSEVPSLASFEIGADGKKFFANYCMETLETLLTALGQKAQVAFKNKAVQGVMLANSIVIIDRMARESGLGVFLQERLAQLLDTWRKRAISLYIDTCKDVSSHLFDVIHTNRGNNRASTAGGGNASQDSASILKTLSTKDKDNIKAKFGAFNAGFEDMVAKHRMYFMERETRSMFAKAMQQTLEPLYNRFWDRYHEIDKGRGKHVKYDKGSIARTFESLY